MTVRSIDSGVSLDLPIEAVDRGDHALRSVPAVQIIEMAPGEGALTGFPSENGVADAGSCSLRVETSAHQSTPLDDSTLIRVEQAAPVDVAFSATPRSRFGEGAASAFAPRAATSSRSTRALLVLGVCVSVAFGALAVANVNGGLSAMTLPGRFMDGTDDVRLPVVGPPAIFARAADADPVPALPIAADEAPAPPVPTPTDLAPVASPPTTKPEVRDVKPTAAPQAASTAPTPADRVAIRTLVDRYVAALSDLSVDEAKAVWPGIDEAVLRRDFTSLEQQRIELNGCQMSVLGVNATATCGGVARYVPKVGTQTLFVQRRTWTFNLRYSNSAWLVDEVQSR